MQNPGIPPTYKCCVGGIWKDSTSSKTIDVISPIDNSILGRVYQVTHEEIDESIAKAKKAQKEWQKVPIVKRSQMVHLIADWIRQHEVSLTELLIVEIGKTYADAKDEILRSADMIDYFANEALNIKGQELSGEQFPGYDQSKLALIERVPVGVILAIAPFNYPINLSVSKIAPALVTGDAVIFKPPTQGAISDLYLTEIIRRIGIPEGLISTLTGAGSEIGDYLVTHPGIDMITFTGSSQVGKAIAEKAGMIPLQFECGGNNPAIVLTDYDPETTIGEIVKGFCSYAGQRCTAIKYVLGLKPTIDQIILSVVKKTQEYIKMGDPRDKTVTMGPVISEASVADIQRRIDEAVKGGARIVYGGKIQGKMIEPTILENVSSDMDIIKTETFGPIVCFIRVSRIEEAIEIVNKSTYGLQASIFTKDEGAGISVARQLNVGTIQINSKPQRGPDHFPFLGVKGSGVGVQGISYTLESMTRFRPIVLSKLQ
ncbi:hypothetical protein A3D77_01215 [Candidatus Gottesmanbacteria bacterium RIFCSPHIGHO2_02_FULL_39_11]|uniref:Aldehyde dehydrogenase domain-containing protein n=1 Tax=Candidatus Gottesmanbacteria bacterium RIFCSPHIGHO2_02_FULL_39_11 TaxID=1798382 RepID=A0A1F5ZTT2_9BACT|nr:MAG: hypothetical protein A3D77_01215 [Candidatus Gottesmanbacteria bacterium RIFCSPHIGHO2_02_FULL_39_11]